MHIEIYESEKRDVWMIDSDIGSWRVTLDWDCEYAVVDRVEEIDESGAASSDCLPINRAIRDAIEKVADRVYEIRYEWED